MKNDDFLLKSKSYSFFNKEISKNKSLRDALVSFEEVLNIRKNIRIMYNTDDPIKIKSFIGQVINGNKVIEKDYEYVLLIDDTYKKLYEKCKNLLNSKESL